MDSESKRFAAGINWYPGHMKKTREMIQENLKLVDAVIEVIDARIPVSSRNPIIDDLVKNKTRIVVLNKNRSGGRRSDGGLEKKTDSRRNICGGRKLQCRYGHRSDLQISRSDQSGPGTGNR